MIVNKANIATFFVNLKTTFNGALKAAPTQWQKIAMKIPSTGKSNDYSWMMNFPQMRKWVGDKVVKSLAAFKYSVENDDWEATIEVDRNDLEDDQTGIYAVQAKSAGESAAQLPDEIVSSLVNNSFTSLCYDGQYFFDTDHPMGNGVFSNKGTKALSIDTLAAAQASYGAARIQLGKVKDDEGRALNVTPNILLVPVALQDVANALMTTDRLEDGKVNIYKGTAEVVVDPRLTSDTAWFLLDTRKAITPFFYQERKAPHLVEQTDMNADDVFNRKKYKYGAEARAAGGYGLWQLAYGSTGTEV
ncbi:Mu-like prophage major head subunit gpT family protein [Trabulsiella odontotermitis]|uniref:Mu-like prophage major head subunit gpT family protein n=1 Tax=Trabulsiella odontotermitis TaxID=379893 RepID=UPI000675D53C|nr:Mu-like prophage major head subunit gpT family protein [Trabulsiella odontotermitis]KNC89702.1 head protein [Trabulsiella odontotermitis]